MLTPLLSICASWATANRVTRWMQSVALCSICLAWMLLPTTAIGAAELQVGSTAPKLNIEHWVQDGRGKFSKVTSFTPGKVYVVEFWATTCGPCVQSMPHIAELQKTYADKGLQIVSISSEPLEIVKKFLQGELTDEQGKKRKISDVTQGYCLTTDPDGSCEKDYMLAANQDGIPCAFIVGKDAKIEWIGHPMEMDGILDAVIQDKWDRAKYIAEQKLIEDVQRTVGGLARAKKYTEAIKAIEGFLLKTNDPRLQFGLYKSKIDMQIRVKADGKTIEKSYRDLFATCADEPLFVQDVAWSAYENFMEKRIDNKAIMQLSIAEVERALPQVQGGTKANLYDTLGRMYSGVQDFESAIKAQKQAVQFSDGSDRGTFKEFLVELEAESKKKKK